MSVKKDMAVPSPGDDDHRNSAKKDLDMTSEDSGPGMLRPFIFQLTLRIPFFDFETDFSHPRIKKKKVEENGRKS